MRRTGLIAKGPKGEAVVYFDSTLQEYIVRFWDHTGLRNAEADYFTTDLDDAEGTARKMVRE